jgi:hypothetical protein
MEATRPGGEQRDPGTCPVGDGALGDRQLVGVPPGAALTSQRGGDTSGEPGLGL